MIRRLAFTVMLAFVCAGCKGRYADFQLPSPAGGAEPHYQWSARPEPLMRPTKGWEASDVLNPSVVRFRGRLLNLYSGFDGQAWHTGVAESADGLAWSGRRKVLSPDAGGWEGRYIAANGSVLHEGGELRYWYQAGNPPRIGLARSSDGQTWKKEPQPVLDLGPVGSWDERGLGDPYLIRAADALYLYYTGLDRASRQRLGVARSTDGGLTWTKLRGNPVLDIGADRQFDENGLGEPALWSAGGWWWMLYTGRDRNEERRIGLARSRDGIIWERTSLVIAGTEAWDSKVVCDPTVEVAGDGTVRVWFGGGDVASPDEHLHGAIGYGELRSH